MESRDACARLTAILDLYLRNEMEFWPFWREFSDLILIAMEDCEPPFDSRCEVLDQMYEAVYMGEPGLESGPDGILGEPDLKRELSKLRLAVGL